MATYSVSESLSPGTGDAQVSVCDNDGDDGGADGGGADDGDDTDADGGGATDVDFDAGDGGDGDVCVVVAWLARHCITASRNLRRSRA